MTKFVDAQQMHTENPDTFGVPAQIHLDMIESGAFVKISENAERFWVQVTEVDGDKITGRVDNDLVMQHSFKCDDIISFERKNVMGILGD